MLPLAAIPLAVSALQAGAGAIQGIAGAKKRRNTIRPEYAIPDEVRKNLALAETEAGYGLDAASKQIATQGIERGTAAALYGAGTRKAGLTSLPGIVQSQTDAFTNLASLDAMERARKKSIAAAARSEMAGYKDKAFEINKFDPYRQAVDEAQALTGAGLQNIMGGLNTAAMTGLYGGGGGNNNNMPVDDGSTTTPTTNRNYGFENIFRRRRFRNTPNVDYIPQTNFNIT